MINSFIVQIVSIKVIYYNKNNMQGCQLLPRSQICFDNHTFHNIFSVCKIFSKPSRACHQVLIKVYKNWRDCKINVVYFKTNGSYLLPTTLR